MVIGQMTIELHGNKEITLNGYALMSSRGKHMLDEKIVARNLTNDQVLCLICEAEQMLAKLRDIQLQRKMSAPQTSRILVSVPDGIPGTNVGPLGGKKRRK